MSDPPLPPGDRDAVERRIDAAFDQASGATLPAARAAVTDAEDRLHGGILVRSHESLSGGADRSTVVAAAAAVELLWGYCRLRTELLARSPDASDDSPDDATPALLAGDFLYSAAHAALGEADDPAAVACFETVTTVSKRVVEALSAAATASPPERQRIVAEEAVGALGAGSALLGATLADCPGPYEDSFETLGSALAAARWAREAPAEGTRRLDERWSAATERALDDVSGVAEVERLRPLRRVAGASGRS